MKKYKFILNTVALLLFLGVQTPQFAQDTPAGPSKAEQERRRAAIVLLRTINTAEVNHHDKNGPFGTWENLLSSEPNGFDKFLALAASGLQKENMHFSGTPDILPGWTYG
jgi:hypothetical protein